MHNPVAWAIPALFVCFSPCAQEVSPTELIEHAAVVLKIALPLPASTLAVVSPDNASWTASEGVRAGIVEREGPCAFTIKKADGSAGLLIDFKRLSVPIQHSCGANSCWVRLGGIAG